MSPQILVALATAILTAVVTLASVYLTNLNNKKSEEARFERSKNSEREIFRREKLEELYLLFSKWDADMVALAYFYTRVMIGDMDEEDALLGASKNKMSENDYMQRVTMMIDLYFSELKDDLDKVLDSRERVWGFCTGIIPPGARVEDFIRVQEEFRMIAREFKQKMARFTSA